MIWLPRATPVKWFPMSRLCTIAATVALLASFFEAPYFHLHADWTSDHARKNHLGQGLTVHTHLFVPQHRAVHSPVIQFLPGSADSDAIFLAQSTSVTHLFSFLAFLPLETNRPALPDSVPDFILLPTYHSHDPPFVPSSAPRSPPA